MFMISFKGISFTDKIGKISTCTCDFNSALEFKIKTRRGGESVGRGSSDAGPIISTRKTVGFTLIILCKRKLLLICSKMCCFLRVFSSIWLGSWYFVHANTRRLLFWMCLLMLLFRHRFRENDLVKKSNKNKSKSMVSTVLNVHIHVNICSLLLHLPKRTLDFSIIYYWLFSLLRVRALTHTHTNHSTEHNATQFGRPRTAESCGFCCKLYFALLYYLFMYIVCLLACLLHTVCCCHCSLSTPHTIETRKLKLLLCFAFAFAFACCIDRNSYVLYSKFCFAFIVVNCV